MIRNNVYCMPAREMSRLLPLIEEFAGWQVSNPKEVAQSWLDTTVELVEAEMCRVYFVTLDDKPSGDPIGLLSVYVMPHPWTGRKELHEQIWFVTEEHREFGAGFDMLRYLDLEAERLGIERIVMTHLNNPTGDRLRKVLHRFGNQHLEINYYKDRD